MAKKKKILISVTDDTDKFLDRLAQASGLDSKQEVITNLISVVKAYQKKRRHTQSNDLTNEVSEMFDELSSDSALLTELNGWVAHQGGGDDRR